MAKDVPSFEPTDRLLDATDTIVSDAETREDPGLVGSSLGDAIAVVTAAGETTVHASTAGRHARPPFVNVAQLDSVTIGQGQATESYGRQDPVHQVSVFRGGQAEAAARRVELLAAFAVAGFNRWLLVDADLAPFEDDTLHPLAWVAPFTVRDLGA